MAPGTREPPPEERPPRTRPTARGIAVWLISVVLVAVGFGTALAAPLALGLAGLLALLLAGAVAVWTQVVLRRATIDTSRGIRPAMPARGSAAVITVRVFGTRIPRALLTRTDATIRDHVDEHLAPRGGEVTLRAGDTGWEAAYYIEPWARGRWELGPVTLRFVDHLGLWRTTVRQQRRTTVTVGPRTVTLPFEVKHRDITDRSLGDANEAGTRTPNPDDAILREYVPGDDIRRVHWPSTARRRTVMVRTDESAPTTPVLLILDGSVIGRVSGSGRAQPRRPGSVALPRRRRTTKGPSVGYEVAQWPIDLTATLALAYAAAGHRVRLEISTSPGTGLTLQAADGDIPGLLTDVPDHPVAASADDLLGTLLRTGSRSATVILGPLPPATAAMVARRAHHAPAGTLRAVVIAGTGSPGSQTAAETADELRRAGWWVVIAEPQDDLADIAGRAVAS